MHVMLIEPDYLLSATYSQALSHAGHEVTSCVSAQTAILAADQKKPDLVILEIQLIEHSGIEFLYEFRSYSDWQTIPVLVHSQIPAQEFAANWQLLKTQLGVHQYLYKPQTALRQLIQVIDKYTPAVV